MFQNREDDENGGEFSPCDAPLCSSSDILKKIKKSFTIVKIEPYNFVERREWCPLPWGPP